METKESAIVYAVNMGYHVYEDTTDGVVIARSYNVSEKESCYMADRFGACVEKPEYLESIIWCE